MLSKIERLKRQILVLYTMVVTELLEAIGLKTPEVLKGANGLTLTRKNIAAFGDVVKDYSPIHRNPKAARETEQFTDTPVIGVHLAAYGGRIARDLLTAIQLPDQPYVIAQQDVVFKEPVYPEEPINWVKKGEREHADGSIEYKLLIPSTSGGKSRVEHTTRFAPAWQQLEDIDKTTVYREDISLNARDVKLFYELLREKPQAEVPFSLGVARIPSTMLSFLTELNEAEEKSLGGANRRMSSVAYGPLQLGDARIDVYHLGGKETQDSSLYEFRGVLSQDGQPVIDTTIRTAINGMFDNLERFADRYN